MLKGHKPGDPLTVINTMYFRKKDANDKWHDYLDIIYKDVESGIKYKEEIRNPDYEYYLVKPDRRTKYNRLYIPVEDVEKVTVPYSDLEKSIAINTGMKDFFYDNIHNGNPSENRKVHLHPDVFNSDMHIEDHYRMRFDRLYQNEPCSISKAYFDIEVDSISMIGDFPQPGECPVNAISLILKEQQMVYVFLLRTKTNKQISEFEDRVKDKSIFPELTEFVINAVGGPKAAEKYGINFSYNFLFYDEDKEINLIADLFNTINYYKPDFAMAWNMSFDVPYLIARIQKLGYSVENVLCHPDFNEKYVNYYIDERNKNEYAERGDCAKITSYTVYIDQMINFASRRKGQSKFLSFSLDFIGENVAGVRKLDYKDITTSIADLPYVDFKTFVFYNIMDTVVQYCIEEKTGDMDYLFNKSLMNNTRYAKAHRQTVYLKNTGTKAFYPKYIIGNNVNTFNSAPETKYPGGFVADPNKFLDDNKVKVNGHPVEIVNNAIDNDYKSLYPSLYLQFGFAAYNMIGYIDIEHKSFPVENKHHMEHWTIGGAFIQDFQSHQWIEIATRWFNLSDYTTLYHEIEWFFENIMNSIRGLRFRNKSGFIEPLIFDKPGLSRQVFIFDDDENRYDVQDRYLKPDLEKWEDWRNHAIQNPNQHF